VDPALLAQYAAADRYQLITSQPMAAGVPISAARYAMPALAPGVTYTAAGLVDGQSSQCPQMYFPR